MQFPVSGASRFFKKAVERVQFLTPVELLFYIYKVLRAWSVTSTLCHKEGNFQPLWTVKGLAQYTSWKVRVPECVLLEEYEHQHVHIHIHIHVQRHVFFTCVCIFMCVYVCDFVFLLCGAVSCRVPRVVGWLVGCGVVWCGVVCVLLSIYCNGEERSVQ